MSFQEQKAFENRDNLRDVPYSELAESIVEVDTANWAEPWEVLRKRIWEGLKLLPCPFKMLAAEMLLWLAMV